MKPQIRSADELVRLRAVKSLNLLGAAPEERFDRLTRLATRSFNIPYATIALVSERYVSFISCQGISDSKIPRRNAFCDITIRSDEVLVVRDAREDSRFAGHPLVIGTSGVRFYAGCALRERAGNRVATLSIMDSEPRDFSADDELALRDIACLAEQELAAVWTSVFDTVTNQLNRRSFLFLVKKAMKIMHRVDAPGCLLYFSVQTQQTNFIADVDGSDNALKTFGELLGAAFRESDVIARLGGDDFVVFMTNTDEPLWRIAQERLDEKISTHNNSVDCKYQISYSMAFVIMDQNLHHDVGDLLQEADVQMYKLRQQN